MFNKDWLNYHNIWCGYSWSPEDESYTDFGDPLPCNASSTSKGLYLSKIFYKTECIIITFSTDIHGPQRMNPTHFGDLLTFCLTEGCNCCILVHMSDSYWMNYHNIWCRYICAPRRLNWNYIFYLHCQKP